MAKRFGIVLGVAAAGVMALGALLPATARADDVIWSNESSTNSIRAGNVLGGAASTLFDDGGRPCGIAADPAAGKVYWATWDGGEIRVGNLNGTGASTLFPATGGHLCGVAVNAAAGKIYWANFDTNEIRVGNLNGTGASTLFTDPGGSAPSGVAIDPANNKIYWTNQFTDEVRAGNLDGSGTAQTLFSGEDNPIGVAANPAAGKIYWTDLAAGTVRVGPLGGSTFGAAQTLFGGENSPSGPAIDPTTNKIYWTSFGGAIRVGPLGGSTAGAAQTLFSGESASLFAALVKAPVNTGRPAISGGAKAERELTCQNGTWAPDLLASFLFRAPTSFAYQWFVNGSPTPIATSPTFTATAAGNYTCTVTATNRGGSTSQTSSVKQVKVK